MPRQKRLTREGLDGLEAGLAVLETVASGAGEVPLTEISTRLGLYKSRVFRILATLKRRGFVEQPTKGGPYRLGFKLFEMGQSVSRGNTLLKAAAPILPAMSKALRGTVVLRVLSGNEQLTLECVHSPEVLRTSFPVGARLSAAYGSTGKALLAFLPESITAELVGKEGLPPGTSRAISNPARYLDELAKVRALGYAVNLEETAPGVRGVAAPILDREGKAIAAIAASFPAAALPRRRIPSVARQVRAAAHEISVRLGEAPPIILTQVKRS